MSKTQAADISFSTHLGLLLGAACISLACGPNMDAHRVKTPEERLLEQEQLAYEAEQEQAKRGDDPGFELEEDEAEAFDKKGAEMELKRASLSAVTCPEVVEGKHPKGVADISIVFGSDGKVQDATVAAPFEGELAECILNAYRAVIIKPFKEAQYTMAWQLDLTGKKPAEKKPSAKK